MCCLGAFNREEDVVFGYVHFINTECCILSIRTHGCQMPSVIFTEMGVIWLYFPHGCLHADCEKSSRSTEVVLGR